MGTNPRPAAQRFFDKVSPEPNSGCWLWSGWTNGKGYGGFSDDDGVSVKAHRFSYRLHKGSIGEFLVLHSCDNPGCVNPDHLRLGTPADNTADMMSKARARNRPCPGEKHGMSKLTAEQVRDIRSKRLGRTEFASLYGICPTHVTDVQSRRVWKHIS